MIIKQPVYLIGSDKLVGYVYLEKGAEEKRSEFLGRALDANVIDDKYTFVAKGESEEPEEFDSVPEGVKLNTFYEIQDEPTEPEPDESGDIDWVDKVREKVKKRFEDVVDKAQEAAREDSARSVRPAKELDRATKKKLQGIFTIPKKNLTGMYQYDSNNPRESWGGWSVEEIYNRLLEDYNEAVALFDLAQSKNEEAEKQIILMDEHIEADDFDRLTNSNVKIAQSVRLVNNSINDSRACQKVLEQLIDIRNKRAEGSRLSSEDYVLYIPTKSNIGFGEESYRAIDLRKELLKDSKDEPRLDEYVFPTVRKMWEDFADRMEKNSGQISQGSAQIINEIRNEKRIVINKIKKKLDGIEKAEVEVKNVTQYRKEYSSYVDWATSLMGAPDGLQDAIVYASSSQFFPSARAGYGYINLPAEERVRLVANWHIPCTYTKQDPRNLWKDSDIVPIDYDLWENVRNPLLVPGNYGGGAIWYNKYRGYSSRASQRKENVPYIRNFNIARCMLWNKMENKIAAHPSVYTFINEILQGTPKNVAVDRANERLGEEWNPGGAVEERDTGVVDRIIRDIKYRIRHVFNKPRHVGIIGRLLHRLTNPSGGGIRDLDQLIVADGKGHKNLVISHVKKINGLSDEEMEILVEAVNRSKRVF